MAFKVKYWIRNYFGFSRRETNGTLILFGLIIILVLAPFILDSFIFRSRYINDRDAKILDSLLLAIKEKPVSLEQPIASQLFPFNPNVASKIDLIKLGIDEKVAQRIINYREAGGMYRIKSDLLKTYGFSKTDYSRLEKYIDLPNQLEKFAHTVAKNETSNNFERPSQATTVSINLFNINEADTSDLVALRGIGTVLANRIIKFRQSLGGFTNKEQFKEVYGLSPDVVQLLQSSAFIAEDFEPKKISLNFSDRNELTRHPYIGKELSKKIIEFRAKNGPFKDMISVEKSGLLTDSIFYKLKPYIDL